MARQNVTYNVPLIAQCGNMTCWYAAAQMVVRWHRTTMQQCTIAGGGIDTDAMTGQVCTANQGLNPTNVESFGNRFGLNMTAMSLTRDGMAELLLRVGPLWYGGDVRGYRGAHGGAHAVVLRGLQGDSLLINDPWPPNQGTQLQRPYNQFFGRLAARGEVPFLHI